MKQWYTVRVYFCNKIVLLIILKLIMLLRCVFNSFYVFCVLSVSGVNIKVCVITYLTRNYLRKLVLSTYWKCIKTSSSEQSMQTFFRVAF